MRWSQLVIGWLLGLAVLVLVALVVYNEIIPDHQTRMRIRAVQPPQDDFVYPLEVERTRMEVPELAEALDKANATGESVFRGDASHQAYDYLVQIQNEDTRTTRSGGLIFVEWKDRTYACSLFGG